MSFTYTYDASTSTYIHKGTEYKVYTGEYDFHPMLANIIAWGEGDKSLQELYTDLLVWEKKLTQDKRTIINVSETNSIK
jgi:hypothetical protein